MCFVLMIYLAFLESVGGVLERTPLENSIMLLGDFDASNVGYHRVTLEGVVCSDPSPCVVTGLLCSS